MKICSGLGLLLVFLIVLIWITMVYLSLWLNTIVLWNPASVMITFYLCWPLGGAIMNIRYFIWKNATKWYKCKDLKKYIKDQNHLVYNPMGITLKYEPKAYWITFSFIDGSVFEQEIFKRRKEYAELLLDNVDNDQAPHLSTQFK